MKLKDCEQKAKKIQNKYLKSESKYLNHNITGHKLIGALLAIYVSKYEGRIHHIGQGSDDMVLSYEDEGLVGFFSSIGYNDKDLRPSEEDNLRDGVMTGLLAYDKYCRVMEIENE